MTNRFPGYDVLAKRDTLSWNDKTREVIDERIAMKRRHGVLDNTQLATLCALVDDIVPQPEGHAPADTVALLLAQIGDDEGVGFRPEGLPRLAEAWRRGLDAIETESQARHATSFAGLDAERRDALLTSIEQGDAVGDGWREVPAELFFEWRLLPDIVSAHYAQPSTWSAMGFGGPASPRGYVRLRANMRDPWEAAEVAEPGDKAQVPSAEWKNRHAG